MISLFPRVSWRKTILIAEDDESDAALLIQTLKAAGVSNPLVTVTDGDEVISYLLGEGPFSDTQKNPLPSVLLLDLKMPRVDGYQVLEWLSKRPELKPLLIVVLTGAHEYKEAQKAYQRGAHSFLTKPCTTEDVQNLKRAFAGHWESFLPPGRGSRGAQIEGWLT